MTTANKTIKINDVEAAKKLVSAAVRCPFDIDIVFCGTTLIISKKPGNTGISRDIRTEFTTDLLLSD